MGQLTVKSLARKLNLSASTVSRALRNHPDISPSTKKRVQDLAKQLDYYPDSIARSLSQQRSNMIGVIVPEITHNFFSAAISGIEGVAYNSGYVIIVCESSENYEREVLNTQALYSNRVAGLIVSISQNTPNGDHFKSFQNRDRPIVFFDRVCKDVQATNVIVDDFEGSFSAVEYLIKAGYKRIAHLAGPHQLNIGCERLAGYIAAHKKYNLIIDNKLIYNGGLTEQDGIKGVQKLIVQGDKPDAIFAVNDPVAFGACTELKARGINIPENIAIVGFSNDPVSALITPSLSTVEQPAHEMGKVAAQLLLEEIECKCAGVEYITKTKKLKTKLVLRDSTKQLN